MEMTSLTIGMLISAAVIGLVLLVRWIMNHTKTVAELKTGLQNMEQGIEHTHRYMDAQVQNASKDIVTITNELHDRITKTSEELHDKVNSEVKNIHDTIDGHVEDLKQNIVAEAQNLHNRVDEVDNSINSKVAEVITKAVADATVVSNTTTKVVKDVKGK